MLVDILGVVNDVPVPNELPPVETAYQFKVPALAVAPNVTVPASQREVGVVPDIVGVVLTVASTEVLEVLVQALFVAST